MDDRLPQGPTTGSRPQNQWGSPGEPLPVQGNKAGLYQPSRLGSAAVSKSGTQPLYSPLTQQQPSPYDLGMSFNSPVLQPTRR